MIKKLILLATVALAAWAAYHYYTRYTAHEGPAPIRTTGVVEATETNIASKVAGRLTSVLFREGEAMKAGGLVATIESEDLAAASRQAMAALNSAESSLKSGYDVVGNARALLRVAESEVKSSEAHVATAEAQSSGAEKDYNRLADLYKRGIVAQQDLDHAQTARDTSASELSFAKSNVASAKSRVDAARTSLKKSEGDINTLRAVVGQASEEYKLQEARLSYANIYAPVDGTVEYRSLEPGEVVAPGTSILTLVDLSRLWVRVDLEEGDVARVKVGAKAQVTLERVPGKVFEGTVYDIGREGEFAVERDVTRGRQDIKSFRTRLWVKDPEGILKPGMTVIVAIPGQ